MRRDESLLPLIILAVVAVVGLLLISSVKPLQYALPSMPTGAAVAKSTSNTVLNINVGSTKGTLRLKNRDGKTVTLSFAADGSTDSGSSENEPVLLSIENNPKPEDYLYLEGETCTGSASINDCLHAQFLVLFGKDLHVMEISAVDTTNNELRIEDEIYGQERTFSYNDGSATTFTFGDGSLILTLNEATKTITFTSIGSSNGATAELADKATITLINTNLAAYTFEGIRFSEYNDRALLTEKYIANFLLEVFYDDARDQHIEISNALLSGLTTTTGSGWYRASPDKVDEQVYLSAKGTLFTYNSKEKDMLKIGHLERTSAASVRVQPVAQESSGWTLFQVDTEGDVGKDSSLVLDAQGYAHMSYYDTTRKALKYAYQTAEGWYVQVVDTNVDRASDIALDSKNRPFIVYTDAALNKVKYAWNDGTSWKRGVVAESKNAVLPTVALDYVDLPHVAYYDFVEKDPVYAHFDGTAWKISSIDMQGDVGVDASIAVDAKGNSHIAYVDQRLDVLKYVWFDGSVWKTVKLDAKGTVGLYTSIFLDGQQRPWIWYYDMIENKVRYMHYLGNNKWDQQTFSLTGVTIYTGDLILDSTGKVHFSYYWEQDKDLRYAVGVVE